MTTLWPFTTRGQKPGGLRVARWSEVRRGWRWVLTSKLTCLFLMPFFCLRELGSVMLAKGVAKA